MSFFARLLGKHGEGCSAKAGGGGGGVPLNGKRQAPSSPASGSFAPEFAVGRQPPAVVVKLQAAAAGAQHEQPARASMESEDDDCTIHMPGPLSACHDRNRSNSLARRRAALDISPRAVQRLADKVALLDALGCGGGPGGHGSGGALHGGDGATSPGGLTRAEVEDLYSDMQLIHRGRWSMVYRAREARTGRRVIIKAYDAASLANATRRATLERHIVTLRAAQAATAAGPASPPGGARGPAAAPPSVGLVRLERVVENPAGTYLVLQACNGGTLIEAVANAGGKLPERQVAIKVVLPLLHTLAALHGAGVVHRDIKPEHLMIHNGGLRLGDFGAAGCMTNAAAALASSLEAAAQAALQAQQQQQQQQAAAADSEGQQQEQLDQQQVLQQLHSLHQQAVAAAATAPSPRSSSQQQQQQAAKQQQQQQRRPRPSSSSSLEPPRASGGRRSTGSAQRFGPVEADSLAAAPSGPLSALVPRDGMNYRAGSIEYMAPELLSKPTPAELFHLVIAQGIDEDDLPVYDAKVDVWALGVVAYEALSGLQPFLADSASDMAGVIATKLAARPSGCGGGGADEEAQPRLPAFIARLPVSAAAKDFLAACLTWDPAQRPSAAQLVGHPWLLAMQAEAAAVAASRAESRRRSLRVSLSQDGGAPCASAAAAAAAAAAAGAAVSPRQAEEQLSLVDPVVSSMLSPGSHGVELCENGLERSLTSEQLELGALSVLRTATQRLDGSRKLTGARVHAA